MVEELSLLAIASVVAAALLEDIGDPLIGSVFARPNLTNAFQQLIEIVLPEGPAIFELRVIDDETLDDDSESVVVAVERKRALGLPRPHR